jgi:tetratricopeptide (TPR) repeat protein
MRFLVSILLFLFVFLCPKKLFSQEVSRPTVFTKILQKKTRDFMKEPAFAKAQTFYIDQQWDSTLVYTSKQLNLSTTEKELTNFCHFFRGYAFNDKQIFKEAEKEFNLISEGFAFYGQVKMYLGGIALELQQYEKALGFFEEVDGFSAQELLGIDKNYIEENIGICYLHLEKFDNAEPYLLKSIQYQEKKKDTLQLIGSYGNLANSYYEQYRDAEAIVYFTKAYELSKKVKDFNSKIVTAANMAAIEKNRKDFSKALTYQMEYGQWKDSLNNQANIYKVAQLEKEFAVKQNKNKSAYSKPKTKLK